MVLANTRSAYGSVFSARFRELLQYRGAAIAGFGTQLFWGLIRCMIFRAFFDSSTRVQPMSLDESITYIWLGQAFFALLPWSVDTEVRAMIRTGTVAYEMLRPVDVYSFWFCRALAARVAPTVLRAIPMFVVAGLFLGLKPPPSVACAFTWILAMVGAALLAAAFSTFMTISLLWTASGDGINRLAPATVMMFSGMVVPLVFFPAWCQPVLNALPFRFVIDVPFRIYMGHLGPSAWAGLFVREGLWIMALVWIGRMCLRSGLRRLVVQGG